MAGKLYIKTHGCQMNEYDSAKMADVLGAAHGLILTDNEAEADVILVNTCSIREKAQEKVFSQLGRWKTLKQAMNMPRAPWTEAEAERIRTILEKAARDIVARKG